MSPKSSWATNASTPWGREDLNWFNPCFILLHTGVRLFWSCWNCTITMHMPFWLVE